MTSPESAAWVQRILAASRQGDPPSPEKAMPGAAPPKDLSSYLWCNESMPAAVPGWPPTAYPWLNKLDGIGHSSVAPTMPSLGSPIFPSVPMPDAGSDGVPVAGPTRRKDRLSEVDKLKARMTTLEKNIALIADRFEELLVVHREKTARRARAASGGTLSLTATGSEHIDHGSTHVDHGSDHRRERTELNMTFEDLDTLKNSSVLDEFVRSF